MQNKTKQTITICLSLWLLTGAACSRAGQSSRAAETSSSAAPLVLKQVGRTQMLRSREGDPRPFFRAEFNVVDREGNLKKMEALKDLKSAINILGDPRDKLEFKPLYAASFGSDTNRSVGSEMLLLIDVSGSMKATMDAGRNRLQVAQEAAQQLLLGFRDGVDRIAIAPFESRAVKNRIREAEFVDTVAKAQGQIAALSLGDEKGNTALYSATETALRILQERSSKEPSRQYLLAVLTDGINDVDNPIDEKGLLGDEGLGVVKDLAGKVGIPVYTIGVGTPGKDFNKVALSEMVAHGGSYSSADNPEGLRKVLESLRRSLQNRLRVTFFIANRRVCGGLTSIRFNAQFTPPGKGTIESDDLIWTGGVAGNAAEGELDQYEKKALTDFPNPPPPCDPWRSLLWRFGMLGLLSAGLAALWFFVPRFFWPRPPLPQIPGRDGQRPQPARKPPRASRSASEPDEPAPSPRPSAKPRRQSEQTRIYDDKNPPGK
jgi:Mg-chelatase subunit ChlD